EAVHELDLGTTALFHILRHRRALIIAPLGLPGAAIHQQLLDLRIRRAIALHRTRQGLRRQRTDLAQLVAELLADPNGLAAELDTDAAYGVVVVACIATHAGRRRHAVAHAVHAQLGPPLAPQTVGGLGGIDTPHDLRDLLRSPRDPPVRLTDVEGGDVGALGIATADMPRLIQVNTDAAGDDAAQGAAPTHHAGHPFLIDAILHRHHAARGRQVLPDQRRGPNCVVRLDRNESDVDRPLLGQVLYFRHVHHIDLHGHALLR